MSNSVRCYNFRTGFTRIMKIGVIPLILASSCVIKQRSLPSKFKYMGQYPPTEMPQIFAPTIISVKGRFEAGFTISPNGKSMAFGVVHESDPKETSIYLMSLLNGKWSSPDKNILPDNIQTFFPMFGPDGKQFYFAKMSGHAEPDLWVAKYVNNHIIDPQPVATVNSISREAGHGKSIKGSIYFTSNRDDRHRCCGDIFRSVPNDTNNDISIRKIDELSTDSDEESLYLSPDENYIIIQSWKNEFQTKHDLYVSYRTVNDTWTTPVRLDSTINSSNIEQRPFVTPDKKYLFFNRTEGDESDLYWVSTKRIFKPYVYNSKPDANVTVNKHFYIELPHDLFKDIDDSKLSFTAAMKDGAGLPKWIKFNSKKLTFTGVYKSLEPMSIIVKATDNCGNMGTHRFKLNQRTEKIQADW